MTPATAFALLILSGAPDLPPTTTGLYYKYAVIDYYATDALYSPGIARRQIQWESGMGRSIEAWRWIAYNVKKKTRHHWVLISRGAAMLNVKHEREHFANAGVKWTPTAWRDFRTSVQVGMSLMGRLLRYYHGDVMLALAAYNAGRSRIDESLDRVRNAESMLYAENIPGWQMPPGEVAASASDFWPAETCEYIRRVMR